MASDIRLPKAGLTADEAVVIEWLVPIGGAVTAGQTVVVVETDKAAMDVAADVSGFLEPVVATGVRVGAGETLGRIWSSADEVPTVTSASHEAPSPGAPVAVAVQNGGQSTRSATNIAPASWQRMRASMAARALARASGLDLTTIIGTGPGGRIVRVDVERAAEKPTTAPVPHQPRMPGSLVALAGRRQTIARHLEAARDAAVPLTINRFADCAGLLRLRDTARESNEAAKVTLTECAAVLVARVLIRHPMLNGTVTAEGLLLADQVDLGVAVDSDDGLAVAVIADAARWGVTEFGQRLRPTVERVRTRRATEKDLSGGTFTLTNLGQYGVDFGTPVLNWPQVAILGLGRVLPRESGPEIGLSLTVDHRFVDGVPAARFLSDVAAALADPAWVLR